MLQDEGAGDEDEEDAAANGGPAEAVTVTADDLAEDEWGPAKKAGKKGKEGKNVAVEEPELDGGALCDLAVC